MNKSEKPLTIQQKIILTVKSKKLATFNDIICIIDLIAKLYTTIKKNAKNENANEIKIIYKKSYYIPKTDSKIVYDILYNLFMNYPDKSFTIKKHSISLRRSYFVYKITFNNAKHPDKYVIFDSAIEDSENINNTNYIYFVDSKDELKDLIKDEFPTSSYRNKSMTNTRTQSR